MSYSSEQELLAREFEQWYRTVPANVNQIVDEINSQPGKGAFDKKGALYRVAAQRLDIKVFRHFPFFFELSAGQSRAQRAVEGLSGLNIPKPTSEYDELKNRLKRLDLALLPENPYVMNLECGAAHVIEKGTDELRHQIHVSAEHAQARRRRDFCVTALEALDAADTLCARFSELAAHMAGVEIDPRIKANLNRMAGFSLKKPADGLFSALQGMIFWRELAQSLEGANYTSWGCLDADLAPYYDMCVQNGEMSADEAKYLLRCFMTYHRLRWSKARFSFTLGAKPTALTMLMLSIIDDDMLQSDDIYLYTGEDDPEDYRAEVLRLMQRGATLISRDRFQGTVEMVGSQAQRCGIETRLCDVIISLPAVLMGTLLPQNVERWQGLNIDCYDGDFFAAEDIYNGFMDNLAALEQDIVSMLMRMLEHGPQSNPLLLQSVSMPDCISRARDVTECGALSTSITIGFDGLGVFLRSLSTIKQLCYDSRRVPLGKVFSTLRANYEGDEVLYHLMSAPKPEIENALLEKFLHNVDELFMAVSERPEISVRPSLMQISRMGSELMATPDGRFAGEGLESDMLPQARNQMGGGVACQWAPENDEAAKAQLREFINSGAGLLMLYIE